MEMSEIEIMNCVLLKQQKHKENNSCADLPMVPMKEAVRLKLPVKLLLVLVDVRP